MIFSDTSYVSTYQYLVSEKIKVLIKSKLKTDSKNDTKKSFYNSKMRYLLRLHDNSITMSSMDGRFTWVVFQIM